MKRTFLTALKKFTSGFFAASMVLTQIAPALPAAAADVVLEDHAGLQELADSPLSADSLPHEHNSAGWSCTQTKTLTCPLEEHTHSTENGCYTQSTDPICGMAEGDGAHTHGGDCYQTERTPICGIAEGDGAHTHGDGCYETVSTLICGIAEGDGAHAHDEGCYDADGAPVCGLEESEGHAHSDICYTTTQNLTCGQTESAGHVHGDNCYSIQECLICDKAESAGHIHDLFDCYFSLTCTKSEHTHNTDMDSEAPCYELVWNCQNEFKLLTVEYRLEVDNTVVSIAETYQALLPVGYEYTLEGAYLPDLTAEGYVLKKAVKYTTSDPDGDDTQTDAINAAKKLTGTITEDTKWILSYGYQEQLAPYRAYYWGHDAKGNKEILLYAFEGQGPKDIGITVPDGVNSLMDDVLTAIDTADITPLGDGEAMVNALIQKVDEMKRTKAAADDKLLHDITPFLRAIAEACLGDGALFTNLTRKQIKQYIADNRKNVYTLDLARNKPTDAALLVTSDKKAEKNLFYIAGDTCTVKFETGLTGADVWGLDKFASEADRPVITPPQPDGDGVTLSYQIGISANTISSLPGVDIHEYVKNIYAAARDGGYEFVGWWYNEDGQGAYPITDYTDEKAKTQYKFLTDNNRIIAPDKLCDTDENGNDAGLNKMPADGRTYYGIWRPNDTEYVVQIWFESPDGKFYYHDHDLDTIARAYSIGETVGYNGFDISRAAEQKVVDAANHEGGATFPVAFADPDSDASDTYYGYNDYMHSPFYGFDFHACENDTGTGHGDQSCIKNLPHKTRIVDKDGHVSYTDYTTGGNLCNCEKTTLNPSVSKVLNVYYSREMWKIKFNAGIWSFAFKDGSIGGRQFKYISEEVAAPKDGPLPPDFPKKYGAWTDPVTGVSVKENAESFGGLIDGDGLPKAGFTITLEGKYGSTVPSGYEGTGSGWGNITVDYGSMQTTLPTIGDHYYKVIDQQVYLIENVINLAKTSPETTFYKLDGSELAIPFLPEYWYNGTYNTKTPQYWLDYKGLTTIAPYMFTDVGGSIGLIQTSANIWKGNKISAETTYNPGTNSYVYGTHQLELYPFFGDTQNTFHVDFYLQNLPDDTSGQQDDLDHVYYTKMAGDGAGHTHTIAAPYDQLSYRFTVPEGFTALRWKDTLQSADATPGGTACISAAELAGIATPPNLISSAMPGMKVDNGTHNAGFAQLPLLGHNLYQSDWLIQQASDDQTPAGYLDPSSYWITDWVRATKEDGTEYSNTTDGTVASVRTLETAADEGDVGADLLLQQLRSTVQLGFLHPEGLPYTKPHDGWYHTANGTISATGNAVALFARNQYRIHYNTCFLNRDGKLLTDADGKVKYTQLYSTPRDIWYGQKLDASDRNYYNAFFAYDAANDKIVTLDGMTGEVVYTDSDGSAIQSILDGDPDKYANISLIGGYGQWYLDPDGTVPFNAEALATMPAGDIDVYYHFSDFRYKVVFVDELNRPQDSIDTISRKNQQETIAHVQATQSVVANGKPDKISHLENDAYIFAGWYQEPEGIHLYDFDKEIVEDTPIYAIWRPKIPTTYEILHILVDRDGNEIKVIKKETGSGYVGDTIHGKTLQNVYSDGLYYVADDYSRSMVLVANPGDDTQNNLLIYKYRQPLREYVVEYRDINNPDCRLLPDKEVQTTYRQITEKYAQIDGWEYVGNTTNTRSELLEHPYVTIMLEDGIRGVITFWYERVPTDDVITALKLVDGVLSDGTWFDFELVDASGKIVRTARSTDGFVRFDSIVLDKPGTYRYQLREVNKGDTYRIQYDSTVYDVVIEVTQENLLKPLVSKVTYYKNGALYETTPAFPGTESTDITPVFQNHRLPAQVQLKAVKYLNDQLYRGDDFHFLLEGGEGFPDCGHHVHSASCYGWKLICEKTETASTDAAHKHTDDCYEQGLICPETETADHKAHTPDCYHALPTVSDEQTASNGEVAFQPFSYSTTGVYVYNISEKNDGNEFYTYDSSAYRAVVEVFINDKNELDTKVTLSRDGEPVNEITFSNYTAQSGTEPAPPDTTEAASETETSESATETEPDTDREVKTGDDTPIGMYVVFCISAFAVCTSSVYRRRRRN